MIEFKGNQHKMPEKLYTIRTENVSVAKLIVSFVHHNLSELTFF